jgi:hypothetical protein
LLPLQPGSEGREASLIWHIEIRGCGKRRLKNKIYFIWKFEKDAYLCNPNGNEGKTKNRNGGCRKDNKQD